MKIITGIAIFALTAGAVHAQTQQDINDALSCFYLDKNGIGELWVRANSDTASLPIDKWDKTYAVPTPEDRGIDYYKWIIVMSNTSDPGACPENVKLVR
jgi:hypothetical protein